MSITLWAWIAIALSFAAYWKNRFPKARTIAVFTGILIAGFTGWIMHTVARAMTMLGGLIGPWAAKITGAGGGVILAIIVALMLYHLADGWHPKGSPRKSHFWVAVALAVLIVAGGTPFAALNQLPASVRTGISTTTGG